MAISYQQLLQLHGQCNNHCTKHNYEHNHDSWSNFHLC